MIFQNQFGTISIPNHVLHQIINYYLKKCFGVKKIKYKNFFHCKFLDNQIDTKNGIIIQEKSKYEISITLYIYVQYGINIYELCKSIIKEVKYEIKEIASINLKNINIIIENINN